ncbi:hypothetical protein HPQ61_23020 [Acetobacteraceae bacterium]|nr:hypothetical protein [Acetobacteraceae bacterium]
MSQYDPAFDDLLKLWPHLFEETRQSLLRIARAAARGGRPLDWASPQDEGVRHVTPSALAATAHHEAGHAIAALLKSISFRFITIESLNDYARRMRFLRSAGSIERIHGQGIVVMAGGAAQHRFSSDSVNKYHESLERDHVTAYALDATGSTEQAELMTRLWDIQARELVAERWLLIERLAAELLVRGRLSAADCRKIAFPAATTDTSA